MTRIYLSPPHIGSEELELVKEAFASNWVAPLGPHVDAFEKEFAEMIGVPYAAALSSGTAALHLALKGVGVQPGDEVFCSTLTFSASANPILYEGGRPVFIDSERGSWNMDPDLLSEELAACAARGRLPRAVIVVDLYGQGADYDRILSTCAEFEVPVIEDAAEALGVTAHRLKALGLIDKIVNEPVGGAHRDSKLMASQLKRGLNDAWRQVADLKLKELLDRRYERLQSYGRYTDTKVDAR